jgi:hypothetical protein
MSLRSEASGTFLGPLDAGDTSATGAFDFMSLPRLPRADVVSLRVGLLYYEAPGDPARALTFCAGVLGDRGWRECPAIGLKFASPIFATACYEKSGYSLLFTARPAPRKPGKVAVTLENMGNVDTRTLPRLRDATPIWSARISTTYVTSARVRAAADFTREALAELGWNDYTLVESRHDECHENETFRVGKDGISLTVRVSLGLTRRDRTLVQYNTSLRPLDHSTPSLY